MQAGGRALKEHIEREAGITFVESASGWKAPCPFEKNSTGDSFLVFNSPEGDFYCFSCKAKGGIADFDLRWRNIQSRKSSARLDAEPRKSWAPDQSSPAQPRPEPVSPIPAPEPEVAVPIASLLPRDFPPVADTPETTAALVGSLRSQLDYMQRQNEGLHGLVLKYNSMLIESRQSLMETKALLLEDSEQKQRLEEEVRVQQQRIEELERQLDRWRVIKSEMESFIDSLESFTQKLRGELLH